MHTTSPGLLEAVEYTFNLPPLHIHERVTRGVLSQNHVLSDGNTRYFLKQWRITKEERLREVLQAERYFASHGIPVILPLQTRTHDYIIEYEGLFYSLYPYIDGVHIEREHIDGEALESMAVMVAQIHKAGYQALPEIHAISWRTSERAQETFKEIQEKIESIKEKSDFDLLATECVSRKIALIESNTLTPEDFNLPSDTLIHGDFHESNIFFNHNHVSHVFDFEKAEHAPRSLELARCVRMTFMNGSYTQHNLDRAARFITTYAKEYPITAEEVRLGLKMWFVRGIYTYWIVEEHYLKQNTRPDVFLESEVRCLRYESEHLDEMVDILTQGLK
jgi:homoserine kinase type II